MSERYTIEDLKHKKAQVEMEILAALRKLEEAGVQIDRVDFSYLSPWGRQRIIGSVTVQVGI